MKELIDKFIVLDDCENEIQENIEYPDCSQCENWYKEDECINCKYKEGN